MAGWNELLRQAREATGLSRRGLADRARVSEDTIFSYEAGRRRPRRETLLRLMRAMKLDGGATNAILEGARLDAERSAWSQRAGNVHRDLGELPAELAAYAWPSLALNERFEIVAWNAPALRVAELDFARDLPLPPQRNLLRIAAMKHFRDRVLNWDAVVTVMAGMYKNHHMGNEDLAEGSPYFQSVVNDIMHTDPDAMPDLMRVWFSAPPRPQSFRHTFFVRWRVADGTTLAFDAIITNWSDFDGVSVNDWHPADAATWTWLGR